MGHTKKIFETKKNRGSPMLCKNYKPFKKYFIVFRQIYGTVKVQLHVYFTIVCKTYVTQTFFKLSHSVEMVETKEKQHLSDFKAVAL
jgi:hypothetical protein